MLFKNLYRKIIAIVSALVIWLFVNQTITALKTLPNVPVKVINLPADKTILGLLPNGYLGKRATLTLSGSKDIVDQLEQGDLEVHIDASLADKDDWVIDIAKKNLVSLNPNFDLRHHINLVSHPEFIVKLSKLVTEKVPIIVKPPEGTPPAGYEFLDIWPSAFVQTLSGPAEAIANLKSKGLKLKLNLNDVTKDTLSSLAGTKHDEISYFVPDKWKKISIPFKQDSMQEINDPEAKNLRIDFLKKQLLPIGKEMPINIYYPLKTLDTINPGTQTLVESEYVRFQEGIPFFTLPLYVKNVSRLFLDIVRDAIEIVIIAAAKSERDTLQWSLEVIDTKEMEDTYVAFIIGEKKTETLPSAQQEKREALLRKRFQEYLKKLALFHANGEKLNLVITVEEGEIQVLTE